MCVYVSVYVLDYQHHNHGLITFYCWLKYHKSKKNFTHSLTLCVFVCVCVQVSEEYKLHRETYYLAIDLHDRFLDTWRAIQKEHLQAIGITCLFLASKIEVFRENHSHTLCLGCHSREPYQL